MKKTILPMLLLAALWVAGAKAQNLIEGYTRVLYADELQEGKAYFLISDRTKYAGSSTGKPKGMSYKLDSYTISWDNPSSGIYFVYWGDFDDEEEGFQWIAEKVGDDQWAFKNKVRGEYLGVKNSYDDDVLFSATPVGYTLTDLDDGAGRFYMTSSDNSHSPHVQGYLRSDRPNNSLAKQNVGDDDYPGDAATNGYPGRWQVYEVESYTGNPYVMYTSDIVEGEQYYLVSDRTKFNGSSTSLPKAMACLQENFKINWGDQYVYWGDLDKEADGFVWTAQKAGEDGQWAFLNKENGKYLGNMNTSPAEADVVFSDTPVGYTLTDLEDGAGRFFMTNSESVYSLHVQGYLRSDRPNNSLAKQNVGNDDYPGDGATNGYPGRWKLMKVNAGTEEPSEYFSAANGYYYIFTDDEEKTSLAGTPLHIGDPRDICRIEAIDRNNGLYTIAGYVTGKSGSFVFRTVEGNRKALRIYTADDELIGTTWKLQKIDAAKLDSPEAQLRLALAKKMDEVGNPYTQTFENLSEEQTATFKTLWDKADEAVRNGIYDILFERLAADLDAAAKGEYAEPVYNKYEKKDIRVLSYNVRHCAGNDGSLNLPRTASVIAAQQADVVALQEVDSMFSSRSNYKYQVKELAEATGMYGIFCSALTGYGIGILSKELPLSIKVVSLTSDFEPRRMLMAEYQNYVFASLHVGLSASARRGTGPIIKAAAEEWVETGKPLIIAGDFNDDGTDDEMQGARGVLTEYLQQNGFTYHSDLTTPTWSDGIYVIDNIISYDPIGGVEKLNYEVVNDKVTSDHMPIIADLRVGFNDGGTGIGCIPAKGNATTDGKVYHIDGTAALESTDGITALPAGIYIVGGKKILK